MLTRLASYILLAILSTAYSVGHAQPSSSPEPSARFESNTAYGVPGATIPAGAFTMRVKSHLADRYILHVEDPSGNVVAVFLGLPTKSLASAGAAGKATWANPVHGVQYLKGWYFSSSSLGLEFVYPKDEAVAIAQANSTRVAAIDPASDGIPVTTKRLSDQDFTVVTLWLLTPTHVGAGISATKYAQVASLDKPKLKQLPHTASHLAWFYLALSLCSCAALTLRASRAAA